MREPTGRWPSGQWHQTVNLADSVLRGFKSLPTHSCRGCSSMVEHLPSKQVRVGSIPITRSLSGALGSAAGAHELRVPGSGAKFQIARTWLGPAHGGSGTLDFYGSCCSSAV